MIVVIPVLLGGLLCVASLIAKKRLMNEYKEILEADEK